MKMYNKAKVLILILLPVLLFYCHISKSPKLTAVISLLNPQSIPATFKIGGVINGLVGKVILQNKSGDNLTLTENSNFTFTTSAVTGTTYTVTVLTNPAGQTCTSSNNTGTIGSANITTVIITCSGDSYTISGNLSGLTGILVLQSNGADNISLTANASFTFLTSIASGSPYTITVLTQSAGQTCTISNATGTITAANVSDISIVCVNNGYTISGTIAGLTGSIILQNNLGDNLSITANGSFTFITGLLNTTTYSATILTQPSGQTCVAASNTGTVALANVTNVTVTCTSNSYTVGGSIAGLTGTVVLQDNLGDNLSRAANGVFTFATGVINGSAYSVTVLTNPVGQTCSASTGSGTINAVNITTVSVTCSVLSYTVGGSASGLTGTVVLQNNLGDNLSIAANGAFTFATGVANTAPYSVTIFTQPSGQTCTPSVNTGTIAAANITTVTISCSNNFYTVGGSISGLIGTVVLQNNLGDNLSRAANGAFTFTTGMMNGSTYSGTVLTQPAGQTCSPSTNTGTVSVGNVTTISITCTSNSYTVGGSIAGLTGTVVLQDNLGDNLSRAANGVFTFATSVVNGSAYSVTVLTQPSGQTCSPSTNTGTIAAANITAVSITCSTNMYTVGGSIVSGLIGTVVLQNNGADNLSLSANGAFTFATSIANGSGYSATVLTQPTGQTCTPTSNTGTISANVTTVSITCLDSVKPVVTTFTTAVTTTTSTTVSITFAGSDAAPSSGSLKYLVNESATMPVAGDFSLTVAPTTYTFANANTVTKTLYAWMIDAAGNVSIALTPRLVAYYVIGTSSYLSGSTTAVSGGANNVNPTLVTFSQPKDLALDMSGNLLEVGNNHCVRKIVIATGATTTNSGTCTTGFVEGVAGSAKFASPYAVVIDSAGFIYVTDTNNHCIRKVDPATGTTTTFAGLCTSVGYVEATSTASRFNMPQGIAVDSSDNIYVSDTINQVIRKITPGGVTSLLAGLNGTVGTTEGTGSAARFSNPMGLDVDTAGNVYVADKGNNRIRKITPAGVTSLLVGNTNGYAEGTGAAALFRGPVSVHVVPSGNIYVSDQDNHRIRKISPEGITMLIAGSGAMGNTDGIGAAAIFQYPSSLVIDSSGIMYLAANDNHRIRIVTCPSAGGCN